MEYQVNVYLLSSFPRITFVYCVLFLYPSVVFSGVFLPRRFRPQSHWFARESWSSPSWRFKWNYSLKTWRLGIDSYSLREEINRFLWEKKYVRAGIRTSDLPISKTAIKNRIRANWLVYSVSMFFLPAFLRWKRFISSDFCLGMEKHFFLYLHKIWFARRNELTLFRNYSSMVSKSSAIHEVSQSPQLHF